jgi:4-amino-4-deoxychorismate lyase
LADEIFVCNSIIGIWPVKQIENTHFPVGAISQNMQSRLQQFNHDDE